MMSAGDFYSLLNQANTMVVVAALIFVPVSASKKDRPSRASSSASEVELRGAIEL